MKTIKSHGTDDLHVIEFNVVEQTDLIAPTTIWSWIGSSDDYSQTGIKVAGPVPALFADQMVAGVRTLLERLGYQVIVQAMADD